MVTTTGIGIYQIISLLLALAGFGVSANPKPATVNAVLNYAPADSDVYLFTDLVTVVPGNYQAFEKLADAPELKDSPAIHDGISKAVAKMEPKLDHLVQKSELRWGKIIGAIISVNAILALIAVAIWH